MKKFLMVVIVTLCLIALYVLVGPRVGHAAAPEPNPSDNLPIDEADVDMLARLLWSEARGVGSETEQAAVAWCVLNRVDDGQGTIREVVTAHAQFAWDSHAPVKDDLRDLARDVLIRWMREKQGIRQNVWNDRF